MSNVVRAEHESSPKQRLPLLPTNLQALQASVNPGASRADVKHIHTLLQKRRKKKKKNRQWCEATATDQANGQRKYFPIFYSNLTQENLPSTLVV